MSVRIFNASGNQVASGISEGSVPGAESQGNTSSTPLGPNATFVGEFENTKDYAMINIAIVSDKDSASNGLVFEWSSDGTSVDYSDSSSVTANQGRGFEISPRGKYFRIRFTNGPLAQTMFRLKVVYHSTGDGHISRPLSFVPDNDNFAKVVRAVLAAKDSTGSYVNVSADSNGTLLVTNTPAAIPSSSVSKSVVAQGGVSGSSTTFYTITNGKTLNIQYFRGGSVPVVGGTKVELWYDPNGTGIGMTLIDVFYLNGASNSSPESFSAMGNGTRRISLIRSNLGGGTVEVYGKWEGYEI